MGKTNSTWGNQLIYRQSNQSRIMRNKTKSLKTPSSHPSLLPRLNFTHNFLYLLPTSGAGGRGVGVVVSSSHFVSAAPSSSGGGLLTLSPCSSVGSLPRQTVLHVLLQRESFPQAAVLHELLQRGSPTGSQVLPANLLQRGLLSPWGHRS